MGAPLTRFSVLPAVPREDGSGLVGWWNFVGGHTGTLVDYSGNGRPCSLASSGSPDNTFLLAPGWAFAASNPSTVTQNAPPLPQAATIAFFFNPTASPTNSFIDYPILLNGGGSGSAGAIGFNWNHTTTGSQRSAFSQNGVSTFFVAQASGISAGTWTHIAFTVSSSNVSIYVSGALSASTSSTLGTVRNAVSIGQTGSSHTWSMADIRIYNRVLSNAEIYGLAFRMNAFGLSRGELEMPMLYPVASLAASHYRRLDTRLRR